MTGCTIWMMLITKAQVISMRYASIRSMDISNGEGVGVALFVQGCRFQCKNCFNPDTWDFAGGKEWTNEVKERFLELVDRPYIKRVSILGGEPLAEENLDGVLDLVNKIRLSCPQKSIWLYTGYQIISVDGEYKKIIFNRGNENIMEQFSFPSTINHNKRTEIAAMCDVIIDGQYIDSQRDITLSYRGSRNQRLVDVKASLENHTIVELFGGR